MKTILHILKRDFARLLTTPAALVVVLFMLVLPSLYAWYNVLGFWDPYENTGNLKVVVVNDDLGATSDLTGELHVGDTIAATLEENDRLAWVRCSREEGLERLAAGEVYAVFVIPEDFTANLLSITTGDFTKPTITYYVNEKTGPVAPKITNAGASVLESTINSTFVSTVSQVIVDVLSGVLQESDLMNDELSAELLDDIARTRDLIADTQRSLSEIAALTGDIRGSIGVARQALTDSASALGAMDAALGKVPDDAALAQDALARVLDRLSAAEEALANMLQSLTANMPDTDPETLARIRALADALGSGAESLAQGTAGALQESLGGVTVAADALRLTVHSQQLLVDRAFSSLDSLSTTLNLLDGALGSTDAMLTSVDGDLSRLEALLSSATATSVLSTLVNDSGLDLEKVSEFLGSPTRVETEQLYPLNAYGSAMAPLFMNLTFWIGAFMLLVVIRVEPDEEGIRRMNAAQRYLGRLLFLVPMALLQAIICCAGVLAIGVQAANVGALFLAAMCASFAYLCVIYCLAMSLRHIGKALAIILAFIQIPGATGLYPVEMTSPFFQTVFRFLPFTYGIKGMREAIFGFYGTQFGEALGMLLFFAVVSTLVGIALTKPMANMNRLFAREMRESGVYSDETVVVRGDNGAWERLMHTLRPGEAEELRARAAKAERVYPVAVRVALIGGIAVPVAATAVFALTAAEKTVVLTSWLVWTVAVCTAMVLIENWRQGALRAFSAVQGQGVLALPEPGEPAAGEAPVAAPVAGGGEEGAVAEQPVQAVREGEEMAEAGERSFDSGSSVASAQDDGNGSCCAVSAHDDSKGSCCAVSAHDDSKGSSPVASAQDGLEAEPSEPHYAAPLAGYISIISVAGSGPAAGEVRHG